MVVKHKLKKIVTKIKNGEEKEKVDVQIIFRKQELAPTEMGFLEYLKYVRILKPYEPLQELLILKIEQIIISDLELFKTKIRATL
jgi:hypothetical protein